MGDRESLRRDTLTSEPGFDEQSGNGYVVLQCRQADLTHGDLEHVTCTLFESGQLGVQLVETCPILVP